MHYVYFGMSLFLLINLGAGLWRVAAGPSVADRMLAAQLLGTTAVTILLLLAEAGVNPSLRDVALVVALLSAVSAIAFVQRVWPQEVSSHDPD